MKWLYYISSNNLTIIKNDLKFCINSKPIIMVCYTRTPKVQFNLEANQEFEMEEYYLEDSEVSDIEFSDDEDYLDDNVLTEEELWQDIFNDLCWLDPVLDRMPENEEDQRNVASGTDEIFSPFVSTHSYKMFVGFDSEEEALRLWDLIDRISANTVEEDPANCSAFIHNLNSSETYNAKFKINPLVFDAFFDGLQLPEFHHSLGVIPEIDEDDFEMNGISVDL
ncbi:hypothetical protein [Carp edema virus]|nr:hypothetical protein [Carp edema virus]